MGEKGEAGREPRKVTAYDVVVILALSRGTSIENAYRCSMVRGLGGRQIQAFAPCRGGVSLRIPFGRTIVFCKGCMFVWGLTWLTFQYLGLRST